MGAWHRTQLLLEPEQYEALAKIAEQEGRSLSGVVREIVRRHLAERGRQTQEQAALKALERLAEIRWVLQEEQGIYRGDLLAQVRAEWEDGVGRVWSGEE